MAEAFTADLPHSPLCEKHSLAVWQHVDEQRKRSDPDADQAKKDLRAGAVGEIYYLRLGEHIKIGYAGKMWQRMAAYPPTAVLLAHHPGTRQDEAALHRRFAGFRQAGREWYEPNATILAHIDSVIADRGKPDPDYVRMPKDKPTPVRMRARSGQVGRTVR
jgi:hypothetical protein